MRVLILITLFCNMAFSALYLNGAEYTQIVTINHLQVAETNNDFLYQLKIPRVGALLTAVESADDVAFTNVNDTTRRARWVVYTPDTIFMYSHIAVSSTVDTSYRLQYGKSLNEVNSSATFTNCGIDYANLFNEASGTTTTDAASGITGTGTNVTLNSSGFFYKSAQFNTGAARITPATSLDISNKQVLSYEFVIKMNDVSLANQVFFGKYESGSAYNIIQTSLSNLRWNFTNGTTSYGGYVFGEDLQNDVFAHIVCLFDGSQAGNSNRLKIYVNGEQKTLTFTGTIPGTSPTVTPLFGASANSLVGNLDKFFISTTSKIDAVSRYNVLFNPSTFSTLGTPLAIDVSAEMGIDTLTFTCSAENAITYQWYLDGAEMVGATDSVLVIYADSAFYSTAHTLYCLVNSSVISDSWVITTEFSAEMGIDTLTFTCSAEGAITYQWYDNNVAVTGATDSVYTIYADSVFYSIKHVIYCLVNGTVKSGEWVFQPSTTGSRRSGYRQINMGQGMH